MTGCAYNDVSATVSLVRNDKEGTKGMLDLIQKSMCVTPTTPWDFAISAVVIVGLVGLISALARIVKPGR